MLVLHKLEIIAAAVRGVKTHGHPAWEMKEGTRRGGSALTRREMHAKIQPIRFNENTLSHTQMELADVQKHKKKKAKTQFKVMKKVKCG